MAKYFNTTDNSIGAKLNHKGEYVLAYKEGSKRTIKKLDPTIIDDAKEIANLIEQAVPVAQNIINMLANFFRGIIQRFPTEIIIQEDVYRYTIQPAPFGTIDRVFYQSDTDKNDFRFYFEHKHLGKAKNMLYKALKNEGYV
jgi:hypothetical protein